MTAFSCFRLYVALWLLLSMVSLAGCTGEERPLSIRLQDRQPLPAPAAPADESTLTICVGSMITPQEGYGYYRQLLDYIGEKLQARITPADPGNYREVNRLLERGEVDAAFVCGGPYIEGHDRFGLELLAAPVVKGEAAYYSYLIVPQESTAKTLADFRGKTFAFTDPQSNSGMLVPVAQLAALGEKPETFFREYLFTYAHDRSIQAVADRIVDGAAVDSLIWDFLAGTQPELTARTRIIARFGPYGAPPVVANPHLDPAMKARLKQVLLEIHLDPKGQAILKGMGIDRFAAAADADYDSIRQLYRQHYRRLPRKTERRP